MEAPYINGQQVIVSQHRFLEGTGVVAGAVGYFVLACRTSRFWLNNYWQYDRGFCIFSANEACLVSLSGRAKHNKWPKGIDRNIPRPQLSIVATWETLYPKDYLVWFPSEILTPAWIPGVGEEVASMKNRSKKYLISKIKCGQLNPKDLPDVGCVEIIQKGETKGLRVSLREIVPLQETGRTVCDHKWINVGFHTIKMVCKHCDTEKPQ